MRFSTASLLLLGFLCLSSLVESQDDDCLTINEIACTVEGFETLCELLELSGLDEVLAGNETFTVFAPLNEAFDALPEDLVESLVNSTETLTDVLLYHVVADEGLSEADLSCVPGENLVNMTNGQASRTICETTDGVTALFQKGGSNDRDSMPQIIETDIAACGGSFIHVVNGVLLPSGILDGIETSRAPTEMPFDDTTESPMIPEPISAPPAVTPTGV